MTHGGKMQGIRVLVTGSGTGIGRGVALEFVREGAAVALHYAHSDADAHSAVDEIRRAGEKAEAFQADLADIDHGRTPPSKAIEFLGGLEGLVNNAGITMNKPFLEVTPEQYDTLKDVNIPGMFFVTQSDAPAMIDHGRVAIINLTSNHAFSGMTDHTVCAGTKAVIVAFTRVIALEMVPHDIPCYHDCAGWILV